MDDAVAACKAALEEGIVPGAGYTLLTLGEASNNPIIKHAFRQPFLKIQSNAGIEYDGNPYNVLTGKVIEDFMGDGIIDPAKVVRCCIENAISVAAIALTTECLVAELPKEFPRKSQG
jgi:chaperonin GroEL